MNLKTIFKSSLRDSQGFTLLETMIAMAIMLVSFASILMVESASINASAKAKTMNIVAMLARNAMIEAETEIEGKTFGEVKKEDGGAFKEPYQDYRWKREIKEVEFPVLNFSGGGQEGSQEGSHGKGSDAPTANEMVDRISKLISNFLSKAIREVIVTIVWKKGAGEQSFSVSTYWVDLNHEFQLSE